jgi:16S rRNA (adenine1518-N6/adenine1519-N6)-dimethyltransferase
MNVKEILKERRIKPKKRLGQNFLKENYYLKKIIDSAEINENDVIIEIGSGIGNLTSNLAEKAKKVYAIEKDKNLLEISKTLLSEFKNIEYINSDIRGLSFKNLLENKKKLKIIGNPPFYLSSQLLVKLVEEIKFIKLAVLSFQNEFAKRIIAKSGFKLFGRISILVQIHFDIFPLFKISKRAFYPSPEVDAFVLKFIPFKKNKDILNEEEFLRIIRIIFNKRRKKIINSLKEIIEKETALKFLKQAGINPQQRPEEVDIERLIKLGNLIPNLH